MFKMNGKMNARALTIATTVGFAGVLSAIAGATGCELLVDFDRTKIDAGVPEGGDQDVVVPPVDGSMMDHNVSETGMPETGPKDSGMDVVTTGDGEAGAVEAGMEAGAEAGMDAGIDAPVDAGIDAPVDAGIDAPVGVDAGVDAGIDAGMAAFTISPDPGQFGTVAFSASDPTPPTTVTAPQTFTITNGGTVAATPTVTLGGAAAGDYTLDAAGCGSSVAPAASCTVTVTFKPSATGVRAATLSAAPAAGAAAVLTGTGIAAGVITITPTTQAFGTQTVATASADMVLTVTNGDAANMITLAPPEFSGTNASDFSIDTTGFDAGSGTACGNTLAAGASCELAIRFTPGAATRRYGNVSITATDAAVDGGAVGTASASFTGTGQ